jgi:hypothetical protein
MSSSAPRRNLFRGAQATNWDTANLLKTEDAMAKTCPISRKQFRENAKPVEVTINGVPLLAEVKEFSTGSLGWYLNGKTTVSVGGTPVAVQIGLNLTIVGSKELPKE